MDNFSARVIAYIVSFFIRVISVIPVPILTVLAARYIRRLVPAWITYAFYVSAIARVLVSIPYILTHPIAQDALHIEIPTNQFMMIAEVSHIISWWIGLLFAIAILVVARRMKRLAEQGPARDAESRP